MHNTPRDTFSIIIMCFNESTLGFLRCIPLYNDIVTSRMTFSVALCGFVCRWWFESGRGQSQICIRRDVIVTCADECVCFGESSPLALFCSRSTLLMKIHVCGLTCYWFCWFRFPSLAFTKSSRVRANDLQFELDDAEYWMLFYSGNSHCQIAQFEISKNLTLIQL